MDWGYEMADVADEELASLLDKAAGVAQAADTVIAGVGDLRGFLDAYYRHMPLEELVTAGPSRLAGVAAEHVRLAAARPQGRALGLRHASGLVEQAGQLLVRHVHHLVPHSPAAERSRPHPASPYPAAPPSYRWSRNSHSSG